MKTTFFKTIVPAFVLLLAVTGAFAFKSNDKAQTVETAWINLPGNPCAEEVECTTDLGPECTLFYNGQTHQAFGKVAPMNCSKTLYRIVQ